MAPTPRGDRRTAHPASAPTVDDAAPTVPTVLPISARSDEELTAAAARLTDHLDADPDVTLPDLRYTLARRRNHLSHRHTVIADDIDDARRQLRALADGGQTTDGRTGATSPRLAFVCTGMGPQWWRMCRGLIDAFRHSPTASCAATGNCPSTAVGP